MEDNLSGSQHSSPASPSSVSELQQLLQFSAVLGAPEPGLGLGPGPGPSASFLPQTSRGLMSHHSKCTRVSRTGGCRRSEPLLLFVFSEDTSTQTGSTGIIQGRRYKEVPEGSVSAGDERRV